MNGFTCQDIKVLPKMVCSSNNSYEVSNYNNDSEWKLAYTSSETKINKTNNKYSTTNSKQSENNQTQSNHTQCRIQLYESTFQNCLSRRKRMINNTNKKTSRNIRGKEVQMRNKNKRNMSRPKQTLYNIFKTRKQKITPTKYPYIRCSNKNTLPSISNTSSLPRLKSTYKRK